MTKEAGVNAQALSYIEMSLDLYGIWFVLTQLNDISISAQKALPKLMKKHPEPWAKTFSNNLKSWIESATPQDWNLLEQQDVGGKLTRVGLGRVITPPIKHNDPILYTRSGI